MEDKSVSRKRSNFYKKKHLSKKKRLKYKAETIEYCYLNIYNPLSRSFNNITMWLNLTRVNISSNMITILPSAFGKLRLVALDLSKNYLGTFGSTKWPWIEQNAIRNTLHFLNISNNFLFKLPFHIGRLNALIVLNISQNMLKSLPQSIGNLENLIILDLSYNKLLYLPIAMIHLKNLIYLDISMNEKFPFQIQEHHMQYRIQVQSLVKLSANIVLRYRILYDTILPRTLVQFLEEAEYCCVCDCVGVDLLPIYTLHDVSTLAEYVSCGFEMILFNGYCCPFLCENNPKLGLSRNIRIFAYIIHKKLLRFIRDVND